MAPARLAWIDAGRGIGILLVLYGHALEPLVVDRADHVSFPLAFAQYKIIYAFHMPLFFLLSGFVQGTTAARPLRQTAHRSLTLIAMAGLVHCLGAVPGLLGGIDGAGAWPAIKSAVRPLVEGIGFSIVVVWFLVTLAIVQMLFALAAAARSAAWRVALGMVLAASVVALIDPALPDFWQVKAWAPALLFYTAGVWLARRAVSVPLVLALPCGAAAAWLAGYNDGCPFSLSASCPLAQLDGQFAVSMIQGAVGTLWLFVVTAALGCAAALAFARSLASAPVIPWLGRHSLEIFLANGVVLAVANPILRALPPSDHPLAPVLLVAVALSLNIVAVMALRLPIRGIARLAGAAADLVIRPRARRSPADPAPAVARTAPPPA